MIFLQEQKINEMKSAKQIIFYLSPFITEKEARILSQIEYEVNNSPSPPYDTIAAEMAPKWRNVAREEDSESRGRQFMNEQNDSGHLLTASLAKISQ
ncbi:hypothetical protein OUZ56_016534 [Daphnia magna]|uniref:HMG box domain-containing protein n=1 Tax=Daphnia magna TaxID=35525 RepID=A0ABR0AQT7_9CRUS|nr:hypothetical protein OUZ56_016534 [Daphnia magna]